jgi:hypothetical protein
MQVKQNNSQQIGLFLAVAIGFASMLGAGILRGFSQKPTRLPLKFLDQLGADYRRRFWPGLVASLNAASVYQLARVVSRAGGAYSSPQSLCWPRLLRSLRVLLSFLAKSVRLRLSGWCLVFMFGRAAGGDCFGIGNRASDHDLTC